MSNPQQILERRETVTLAPLLIMQGALDDNVLPTAQEKFAATYKAAGDARQSILKRAFEGKASVAERQRRTRVPAARTHPRRAREGCRRAPPRNGRRAKG